MEGKRGARFLAFDALKGLKENIAAVDMDKKKKKLELSMDERMEIEYNLSEALKNKSMVEITFQYKGSVIVIVNRIIRLDPIKHTIHLSTGEHISILQLLQIEEIPGYEEH